MPPRPLPVTLVSVLEIGRAKRRSPTAVRLQPETVACALNSGRNHASDRCDIESVPGVQGEGAGEEVSRSERTRGAADPLRDCDSVVSRRSRKRERDGIPRHRRGRRAVMPNETPDPAGAVRQQKRHSHSTVPGGSVRIDGCHDRKRPVGLIRKRIRA